ncbi:MAG: hypothetical protein IKB40_04440 [Paludibacteraceae bacterium]|nr:hypothetical protein [Paludibacteraceae bacterium]
MKVISKIFSFAATQRKSNDIDIHNTISLTDVVNALKTIEFPTTILREPKYAGETKEGKIQKCIFKYLQSVYGNVNVKTEYSVGGYWGMRSDIDLFNGQVGIELKVAEQLLNATHVERLIGQVVYYTKRRYTTNNLIVLVVGREKEYGAPMKEIETIIESLGCTFLFKTV